jgi:hypothetical protein
MHESGQRAHARNTLHNPCTDWTLAELNQLTGVAAILTFPLNADDVEAEEAEIGSLAANDDESLTTEA